MIIMSSLRMRMLGKKGIDMQSIHRASDNQSQTPLSIRFYSKANMNLIMNNVLKEVKRQTGLQIGTQSYRDLLNVMRFIFTRLWHDQYNNIPKQINELNRLTVKECVKWILPDLLLNEKFQREVLTNVIPVLDRPKNMSSAGMKLEGVGGSDAF